MNARRELLVSDAWDPSMRRSYCIILVSDGLTVSAVEQDLDAFPQCVDVLRLPDERVPFF